MFEEPSHVCQHLPGNNGAVQGERLTRGGGRRVLKEAHEHAKGDVFGEGQGICEAQSGDRGGQRVTALRMVASGGEPDILRDTGCAWVPRMGAFGSPVEQERGSAEVLSCGSLRSWAVCAGSQQWVQGSGKGRWGVGG